VKALRQDLNADHGTENPGSWAARRWGPATARFTGCQPNDCDVIIASQIPSPRSVNIGELFNAFQPRQGWHSSCHRCKPVGTGLHNAPVKPPRGGDTPLPTELSPPLGGFFGIESGRSPRADAPWQGECRPSRG
jgi:hypothetical protein